MTDSKYLDPEGIPIPQEVIDQIDRVTKSLVDPEKVKRLKLWERKETWDDDN